MHFKIWGWSFRDWGLIVCEAIYLIFSWKPWRIKNSPINASFLFTPSEAYLFPLAGIYLLANAPGWIKLLGKTDRNLPPKILYTARLATPHRGISLEQTATSTVVFGIKEWSFSVKIRKELPLISLKSTMLERNTAEAVLPETSKETVPKAEPIKRRFEVILRGRNNPVCRTPRQRGNVIPLSAVASTASAISTCVHFCSVETTRLQILSPKIRAFCSAFWRNSSAMFTLKNPGSLKFIQFGTSFLQLLSVYRMPKRGDAHITVTSALYFSGCSLSWISIFLYLEGY